MKYYNYNFKYNTCEYCGEPSYKYDLCNECYQLANEEYIIKNEKGQWIKNIIKGNEYRFYDPNKKYKLKEKILNEFEERFLYCASYKLKSKYVIIPQVNLQTIIETDSNKRNDELFRNIDFGIFYYETFKPFLLFEINGSQHYTNEYYIERDKSVKEILNQVHLPLATIDVKDIKKLNDIEINKIVKKAIKQQDPGFFAKIFGKKTDKMDTSWIKTEIEKMLNKN